METRWLRAARVLLATLLVALVLTPATQQAHAVDEEQIRVELDQVRPTIAHSDDTITVKGTVTNVTDVPLHHIQVLLWRDQAPITTTEQLDWVLGTPPSDPPGNPMVNPGNFVDLTRSVASPDLPPTLAPGQSLSFEVSGTIEQMRIPQTNAVYPIGVMVKGNAQANFWPQTVGRGRTLLPVMDDTEGGVRGVLSSLVVLQSTPSQLVPGEFADDHLAEEVGPDGRLTALLSSAARPDVSWAVDPDLIASLEAMAAGYQVRTSAGLAPGSGAVDAARWLEDFHTLDRARGHQLPYAQLDLAAISGRDDADELVAAAVRAATRVSATSDLPVLGLPADGIADQATLDLLQALDPAIMLLSDVSNPDAGIGQLDQTPVLTFAANAFTGGPADSGSDDPEADSDLKVRQQMLASGLVAALRLEPSVRLITTAADAARDEAAEPDYVERRTLSDLADADPTRGFPAPTIPDEVPVLTEPQLALAEQVRTDHQLLAELLVDPGDTTDRSDLATTRALSAAWRSKATAHRSYVDLLRHDANGLLTGDAVTLGQPVPAILTGSTGSFPLTITNNLDVPVRVGVRVESANRSRLTVKSIDQIVVQPGERVQVQIAAEPAGNGEVAVVAQLVTVSGEPLGEPTTRTVIITQYGTVGWAIAIGAGAAFFLFTALRIRKVRRQRAVEPELVAATPLALPSGDGATAVVPEAGSSAEVSDVAEVGDD